MKKFKLLAKKCPMPTQSTLVNQLLTALPMPSPRAKALKVSRNALQIWITAFKPSAINLPKNSQSNASTTPFKMRAVIVAHLVPHSSNFKIQSSSQYINLLRTPAISLPTPSQSPASINALSFFMKSSNLPSKPSSSMKSK